MPNQSKRDKQDTDRQSRGAGNKVAAAVGGRAKQIFKQILFKWSALPLPLTRPQNPTVQLLTEDPHLRPVHSESESGRSRELRRQPRVRVTLRWLCCAQDTR